MPIRQTLPRRSGTRKVIEHFYTDAFDLYRNHADEEMQQVRDLIAGPLKLYTDEFFSPAVRRRGRDRLAALQVRWAELREDILAVQQQYAPDKKPWGVRFDDAPVSPGNTPGTKIAPE